jgi:hypothetical protein
MSLTLTGAGLHRPPAAYTAQGVNYSSTAGASRGAALTGAANSKVGTISFWFKGESGSDGLNILVFNQTTGGGFNSAFRLASGAMRVVTQDSTSTNIFLLATSSTVFNVAGGWHHFAAWWDTSVPIAKVYVDGVFDSSTVPSPTNAIISYASGTDWKLPDGGGGPGNFSIADFWFDPTTALDLGVSANIQKFISGGLAVDLGSTGQLPTGASPIVCMKGTAASWLSNVGTGGSFTLGSGTLTNSSTNPP